MEGIPWVDVDYCQFSDWGYQKPTRIWGGEHIKGLDSKLCEPGSCPYMVFKPSGRSGHRVVLGGKYTVGRRLKYRVPGALVRFLLGVPKWEDMLKVRDGLAVMQLVALPEVRFAGELNETHLEELSKELIAIEGIRGAKRFVFCVLVTGGMLDGVDVQERKKKF